MSLSERLCSWCLPGITDLPENIENLKMRLQLLDDMATPTTLMASGTIHELLCLLKNMTTSAKSDLASLCPGLPSNENDQMKYWRCKDHPSETRNPITRPTRCSRSFLGCCESRFNLDHVYWGKVSQGALIYMNDVAMRYKVDRNWIAGLCRFTNLNVGFRVGDYTPWNFLAYSQNQTSLDMAWRSWKWLGIPRIQPMHSKFLASWLPTTGMPCGWIPVLLGLLNDLLVHHALVGYL